MTPRNRSLFEINQQVTKVLNREIGVVDTLRFLNQFTLGSGNYTEERGEWLDELSLQDIVSEIKANS